MTSYLPDPVDVDKSRISGSHDPTVDEVEMATDGFTFVAGGCMEVGTG